ncbi:RNA-binding protein (U1 snRNP-like), putative [Plasmodium gallinaceum]|uniref:U1 small nuclear ribonucleoprotein C n=1 Tax=Plasmodium gallinaceum TaxID=5849 RepID=A0A1J1GZK5_PLAGA|nr:RNA-binding protein (U1 snRNP-like), putative [Plasmodium gallinaceum]CRG97657.1 RNA-binding protein (U1 snRNP-like), putative [Plasmodium gallinaceum]
MPKYYCEYCDIYLTHSSPVGRRQHIHGRKHISAKIEYFQNLLREEGITPQNFLGFLNNRNYNNSMVYPMMNYMPNNINMYMKYNQMKSYQHPLRNVNTFRLNVPNNKYSRVGYFPPNAAKCPPNQVQNINYPNNNKYPNNSLTHPNIINVNNKNSNYIGNNQLSNNLDLNDTNKNSITNTTGNPTSFNDNSCQIMNENNLNNINNNLNNDNSNLNNANNILNNTNNNLYNEINNLNNTTNSNTNNTYNNPNDITYNLKNNNNHGILNQNGLKSNYNQKDINPEVNSDNNYTYEKNLNNYNNEVNHHYNNDNVINENDNNE